MRTMTPLRAGVVQLLAASMTLFAHVSAQAAECEPWAAKMVSVQGSVEARSTTTASWRPASLNDTYCVGDSVRTGARSRAAIVLSNNTVIRLDQSTTVILGTVAEDEPSWLEMLEGIVHFFSRVPRSLDVRTPYVNAGIEGTEFLVQVAPNHALITVFEGTVAASNRQGSVLVQSGQAVVATTGQAPVLRTVVTPRDAVRWALYYPPIIDYRLPDSWVTGSGWQRSALESLEFYRDGDLADAFASLANVAMEQVDDPRFFTYRAALLLTVGRVDEAQVDIERALSLAPRNANAAALRAIVAVAQNDKHTALDLASTAIELDPNSSPARIALSYARQANFDIAGARQAVEQVVADDSDNALAWARLSELWQAEGYLDRSLSAAQQATALNPDLARTQTVLGFAYLTQIKTRDARDAFDLAIALDQADPLPRLGLGLALIRDGMLQKGRQQIEIAAGLDPNNSLIRSYLGKAYYEEKRDALAGVQYDIAKQLDPMDPTPFLYDGIRKQTSNRPMEALNDLQTSVDLNDNRAVYRSRLLLDEDLGTRSVSLARAFNDIGFERVAELEASKSIASDPSSHSARRFLADSYVNRSRFEIARASLLLQSQLLQPINPNPVQPQIAETNLNIVGGAGPASSSFNEFTPLTISDKPHLTATGMAGNNSTFGDELILHGTRKRLSYSIGQFHYETDGYRENNDVEHDIYNVFLQSSVTADLNVQFEYRNRETEQGDLRQSIDPEFVPTDRRELDQETARVGASYAISPKQDLLASLILSDKKTSFNRDDPPISIIDQGDEDAYDVQVQFISRSERWNIVAGGGASRIDTDAFNRITLPSETITSDLSSTTDQYGLYGYVNTELPSNVRTTLGLSYDSFDDDSRDIDRVNPKVGVDWQLSESLRFRAVGARSLKRALVIDQTLEPTNIAGFNQLYDDFNGTKSDLYGAAIDASLDTNLFGGIEYVRRKLDIPSLSEEGVFLEKQDEKMYRAYLYWAISDQFGLGATYIGEKFDSTFPSRLENDIFSVSLRYFHPVGIFFELQPTYVEQDVVAEEGVGEVLNESFVVTDVAIGYRLPRRRGTVRLEVLNLFDEEFLYEDLSFTTADPFRSNARFIPDRAVRAQLTLNF